MNLLTRVKVCSFTFRVAANHWLMLYLLFQLSISIHLALALYLIRLTGGDDAISVRLPTNYALDYGHLLVVDTDFIDRLLGTGRQAGRQANKNV